MAGLKDFLFGSGSLKKAASTGDSAPASGPAQPAGIDIGKMAQDQANQAASSHVGPRNPEALRNLKGLSTPMTPQTPNSGTKGK